MSIGLGINIQKKREQLAGPLREAIVDGKHPGLLLDFDDEYYLANGGKKSLDEVLTHSRSGNATMVDSDGLLKWAPHNLQADSQDFTGASWSTTNTTVTANAAIAPDGTTTADKLKQTASGDWRIVSLNSVADADYTYKVFLKTVSGTGSIGIRIYDGSSFSDTLCSVTSEWQLFTVSSSGATQNVYIDNRVSGSTLTEVYAWGAHLYRSDLGGMVDNPDRGDSYVPTTSSAVYLPRRGHHVYNGSAWVNEGLLHESEARVNLIQYSIPDSNWTTSGGSAVTEGAAVSLDGATNASKLEETATTSYFAAGYYVTQSASTQYTYSVFAKAAERSKFYFRGTYKTNNDWSGAFFDLSAETATATNGPSATSSVQSASITDAGNGWYRCSVTYTTSTAPASSNPRIGISDGTAQADTNGVATYAGTAGSGIYVYGAQLEAAPTPSSYIPTAGSTVTRAAETLTIPAANLPWPTETYGPELVTNGTFDTDTSGWSAVGAGASISYSSGSLQTSVTNDDIIGARQLVTVEAGKPYFVSAQARHVSGSVRVATVRWANGDVTSGYTALGSTSDSNFTNISGVIVPSGTTITLALVSGGSAGGTGPWVDEYDNISVRELTRYPVSIQMNGRLSYADEGSAGQVTYAQWEDDTNNRITLSLDTDSTATGEVNFTQVEGGTADTVASSATEYAPGILVPYNIASRHGMTFINGAVDGVALTANTTPTNLPDLSTTDLNLAYTFMGTVERFRVWGVDLGDTGLETATAPSLEPSLSLTFDSSESSFVVDDWSA